ncbi:MAG: PBP1A family penicillin-binding protein [Alphaproteobacteria bacterium]|nr:PBP1A family penicillin-binding protein [Alphaproteobacteria bacterium]
MAGRPRRDSRDIDIVREDRGGNGPGRAKRPRRRWLRRLVYWSAVLLVWVAIAGASVTAYYAYDLPDIRSLEAPTRRPAITLAAADGTVFATYGDLVGETLRLDELPTTLPLAVMATEDRRFQSHPGIDPIGLARAAIANLRAGSVRQGGSTITQQLAKNLFLTSERTLKRKVQETILALWLERKFTKAQILTLYLNRVYLGAGTYGVDAAARKYFGVSARQLDLWESAMLAGILKAPSRFNPIADPDTAERRTRQVLANMVDAGFLEASQADQARPSAKRPTSIANTGPIGRYFADWVMDQVQGFVGFTDRDLVVVTTLDPRLQRLAEDKVALALDMEGGALNARQAALVAMAPDGAVRALVGGVEYAQSQFNRATQALRQPGSAFKPMVYLAALQAGYKPEDRFMDGPITIGNWSPRNYEGTYRGMVSLREALAYSINTVAAQLAERVGPRKVVAVAERMGITSTLRPDASIALGTYEVTPLELTAAYASLANAGEIALAYGIREIRDTAGNVLYTRKGSGLGTVAGRAEVAAMNDMMGAAIAGGTAKAAKLDRPAAGKTGTTQDFRDAWFLGYTADLVAGVWVGNDDNKPMKHVTGGGLPARMWRDFMLAAHAGLPPRPLPLPTAAIAAVDPAQAYRTAPIPGTQPGVPTTGRATVSNPESRPAGFGRDSN